MIKPESYLLSCVIVFSLLFLRWQIKFLVTFMTVKNFTTLSFFFFFWVGGSVESC